VKAKATKKTIPQDEENDEEQPKPKPKSKVKQPEPEPEEEEEVEQPKAKAKPPIPKGKGKQPEPEDEEKNEEEEEQPKVKPAAPVAVAKKVKGKPVEEDEAQEETTKPKAKPMSKAKGETESEQPSAKIAEEQVGTGDAKDKLKTSKIKEKVNILTPELITLLQTLGIQDISGLSEEDQKKIVESYNTPSNRESIPWFFELQQNISGEQETLADESLDSMLDGDINVDIPDTM